MYAYYRLAVNMSHVTVSTQPKMLISVWLYGIPQDRKDSTAFAL